MAYTTLTLYGQSPEARLFEDGTQPAVHVHLDSNCYFALEAEEAQALGIELLKLAAVAAAKRKAAPPPVIGPVPAPELAA